MIEYDFPSDPSSLAYCVFPQVLEKDENVFFHATHTKNFESISKGGFKIPSQTGLGELCSVSFARESSGALTHAMTRRKTEPGDFIIFAVRYEHLKRSDLVINHSDIHDYTLEPPPVIIGYCRIHESYRHI